MYHGCVFYNDYNPGINKLNNLLVALNISENVLLLEFVSSAGDVCCPSSSLVRRYVSLLG